MSFLPRWIQYFFRYPKFIRELEERREEVETLFRFETLVHDITTRFINLTSEKYDEVISTLLRDIGEFVGVDRAYLFMVAEDGKSLNNTHEWRAEGIDSIGENLKLFPISSFKWWRRNLFAQEFIHISAIEDLPSEARNERRFMTQVGIHSLLLVPLIRKETLEGVIGFDSVRTHKKWDQKEIYLLESVTQDIVNLRLRWYAEKELRAAEMQLIRIQEEDLETSARIQRTILTAEIEIDNPCVDIAALSIPSQEVDGDFYNAMQISRDIFDLLTGDVMGKGLPGAFIAAAVRNHFLQVKLDMALRGPKEFPGPGNIVAEVALRTSPELIRLDSFVTLDYCRFDLSVRRLDFVDCGHTPLVHFHSDTQRCWLVKGRNLPLGFSETEDYVQHSIPFGENDILFFYSDGISEARNQQGEFFGEQRLVSVIERHHEKSAQSIVRLVKEAVIDFCEGNYSLADDFTCVAVKLRGLSGDGEMVRHTAVFPGDVSALPAVRAFITDCLEKNPFLPEEEKLKIISSGNEAAANVIKHGLDITDTDSTDEEKAGFYLDLGTNHDWLYLCYRYAGKPFNLPQRQKPQIEELKEHGYGVFIMEEFMDSVTYANDFRGGMMLNLVKRFEPCDGEAP
ncbi:MAG: SpoIIE family protein phosphatase [Spirochaetales bacterium]|nr:SpoIIE family protein phosphatase [Spirochaetales bacterium]